MIPTTNEAAFLDDVGKRILYHAALYIVHRCESEGTVVGEDLSAMSAITILNSCMNRMDADAAQRER
jgi:hypothetical protein